MRGMVVPLTPAQVVTRALYLVGARSGHELDAHVRSPAEVCPTIYYRLPDHNGGDDPTAPDPASRWVTDGGTNAVTSDCVGGAAWCAGFDRFQPKRFGFYSGWINTNSMLLDARGPAKCFDDLRRPEPGTLIVCRSGSRGHKVGHVGVVVSVPAEWDARQLGCWQALGVVDIAGRSGRANMRTTGRGWWLTDAGFLRSKMV